MGLLRGKRLNYSLENNFLKNKIGLLKNGLKKHKTLLRHLRDKNEIFTDNIKKYGRCGAKLLSLFDQVPEFVSSKKDIIYFDLCGGPGGFVRTIQDKFPTWRGNGVSLPGPLYYQYSNKHTFNATPMNILKCSPEEAIKKVPAAVRNAHAIDLVMADGAEDCVGRENLQEFIHLDILRAEIAIIKRLRPRLVFLKTFDTFERQTWESLEELIVLYEECGVYKPLESRAANSERYFIFFNYNAESKKNNQSIINKLKCASLILSRLQAEALYKLQ